MEIKDLVGWVIAPFEGCEIQCPECNKWSNHKKWIETEVYCEACGSHSGIQCPKCDEVFDHVWSPEFKVREPRKIKKP